MQGGWREWGAAAATKTPSAGMNYVVTAHPADAVSHALVSNFISEDELDLIVSKGSRLVIYSAGPEGLQPFKEVPMYGRIATMELWRRVASLAAAPLRAASLVAAPRGGEN